MTKATEGRYPPERMALFFCTVRRVWRILLGEWTGSKGRGGGAVTDSWWRGQMGRSLSQESVGRVGRAERRLMEQVGCREAREGGVADESGGKKGPQGTAGLRKAPLHFTSKKISAVARCGGSHL